MNADAPLADLAARTAEAAQGILRMFAPAGVVAGEVGVAGPGADPFADVQCPCVIAESSYSDGVGGSSTLVIGLEGARRLAAAMSGADPLTIEPSEELGDAELAAVGDATGQMMAAAALAVGQALGEQLATAPPELRQVSDPSELARAADPSGQTMLAAFTFCGEPCLLVQQVPSSFVVRMAHAVGDPGITDGGSFSAGLLDVSVRVWAELGRTRLPSGEAVELPPGAVLELDRLVEDAVDVYVDGMRFATCRLVVLDDGGLAMRLETIHGLSAGAGDAVAAAAEIAA